LASRYGMTASQLALAWLLHCATNTLLIPGTTSIAHLDENAKAVDMQLSADDMRAITDAVERAHLPTWRPDRPIPPPVDTVRHVSRIA
jgi:aryl-alcohol dehydrogenase-like predicted oxidoreductase